MSQCQEDGCPNEISQARPESGLCEACWQLNYELECADRQRATFEARIIRAMYKRNYGSIFDAMTRYSRQRHGSR